METPSERRRCCFRFCFCLTHRATRAAFWSFAHRGIVCHMVMHQIKEEMMKPKDEIKKAPLSKDHRKKLISKIQKLWALSGNNPNAPERAEAARMAREMMAKHGIRKEELR